MNISRNIWIMGSIAFTSSRWQNLLWPAGCRGQTTVASAVIMLRCLLVLAALGIGLSTAQGKTHRARRIGIEAQLISRMLSDYDPYQRPPVRGCLPHPKFVICLKESAEHSSILVITNLFINRIRWHDDRAEVDFYLRQQWEDTRLSYDVSHQENIEEVSLPANTKIWIPDTYISTGHEKPQGSARRSLQVEPSGYVRSSEQRTVDVPVHYGSSFPFLNRRSFTLRLSSYLYPMEDVAYLWANSPPFVNPVEVSSDLLSETYSFEEASAGDCVGNYTVGQFSCVDVTVTFSSSFGGSLLSWFLPSLFVIFVSWLHFWIHGSWSVPRTASAALPFFFFAALFVFRGEWTTSAPGLHCWLTFCLVITFFSLLEYFIVICCGIRRTTVRYTTVSEDTHPLGTAKEAVEVAYKSRCGAFRDNNGLDVISRILFPLIFIIFLILYFVLLI